MSTPKADGQLDVEKVVHRSPIVRAFIAAKTALTQEPETPVERNQLKARWTIMLLLCLGTVGSYYVFDIPAATESAMQTAFEGTGAGQDTCINGTNYPANGTSVDTFNNDFNLLYSVYSWPNIVLPFFGGYFSDKLGVRLMGVIFCILISFGQAIVTFGASLIEVNPNLAWWFMWGGRTVFGFGGESLSVAQSAFVASYFQGKELAFAMGVTLAIARVGSVINNEVSAIVASNFPVYWAYVVGFGITILSLFCMVIAYHMDVKAEAKIRKNMGLPYKRDPGLFNSIFCCGKRKSSSNDEVIALNPENGAVNGSNSDSASEDSLALAAPKEEIKLSAVFKFPFIFWVLTLSCLTVYIDVLTYNNNCADFVTQKWLSKDKPIWQVCDSDKSSLYLTANSIMSITYLVAGFLTPVFGTIVDNIGLRAVMNVVAATAITGVHFTLGFTDIYPAAPLVVLGLCYSIYAAALWPSIALVIEPKYQATAYGVVTAVQNFGLAVGPLIVGTLMPSARCATASECIAGWNRTEIFFVALGCAGIFCGLMLNLVDCTRKYPVLNYSDDAIKKKMEVDRIRDEKADDATAPLLMDSKSNSSTLRNRAGSA